MEETLVESPSWGIVFDNTGWKTPFSNAGWYLCGCPEAESEKKENTTFYPGRERRWSCPSIKLILRVKVFQCLSIAVSSPLYRKTCGSSWVSLPSKESGVSMEDVQARYVHDPMVRTVLDGLSTLFNGLWGFDTNPRDYSVEGWVSTRQVFILNFCCRVSYLRFARACLRAGKR
eukprot:scaffold5529_cov117-Cylindrotheca_fusiformis.AAC.19